VRTIKTHPILLSLSFFVLTCLCRIRQLAEQAGTKKNPVRPDRFTQSLNTLWSSGQGKKIKASASWRIAGPPLFRFYSKLYQTE
jgi:hypothetical protein